MPPPRTLPRRCASANDTIDNDLDGDIHYRFVLDLPDSLTAEQEAAVDDLAKVFDGDPRAGLFS